MLMSIDTLALLVFILLALIALLLFANLKEYRQEKTQKHLINSYEQILDHVGAYIYVKDTDCRYVYCNQLTLDYFGVSLEQLKGTSDSDYFTPEVADVLQHNDHKVLTLQRKVSDDFVVEDENETNVYHEVKQPLYDKRGQLMGLIGISTVITEEYNLRAKLEHLANSDPLTGLYNRRSFNAFCDHEFARAMRYGESLSFMIIDIDFFKNVNDTFGHLVGDEVIKRVADICNEHARESDILARIGGEEFAIILPNTDIDSAYELAERLRKAQQQYDQQQAPCITISIGISTLDSQDNTFIDMFKRADKALYSSKNIGRNSVNVA